MADPTWRTIEICDAIEDNRPLLSLKDFERLTPYISLITIAWILFEVQGALCAPFPPPMKLPNSQQVRKRDSIPGTELEVK